VSHAAVSIGVKVTYVNLALLVQDARNSYS